MTKIIQISEKKKFDKYRVIKLFFGDSKQAIKAQRGENMTVSVQLM